MSYLNVFGDTVENEFDETMMRKYGDKYKCVKRMYPDVCKLPETEIEPMTKIIRYKGDTFEEAADYLNQYIQQNEPMWKQNYLDKNETGQKFGLRNLADKIGYPARKLYDFGNYLGELGADAKLAYDYKNQMDDTAAKLVKNFGEHIGAGDGIDEYYHPLLQCELAKISPNSRENGLQLGQIKEFFDYHKKKYLDRIPEEEVLEDNYKDLKNNEYGSYLGAENPNKSCYDLLNHKRTPNMKKMNIW